jgi:adenine-specific DNA-methyltransferase
VPIIQFKGKTAVESYHRVVPHHTLEIDGKLSLAKKPSLDGNLIIEGDNLIALKSLLPTHAGKIKCIYIDPPYNTGNEGWIYNDNLTQPQFKEWIGNAVGKEGEDACRHDKWCCMMYPRLQLLKELLRDDGAIFVSIDDTEVHHLRMMMNEVFGEENFVATVIWEKADSPRMDVEYFSARHDYVVVFAKSLDNFGVKRTAYDEENLPDHYDKVDDEDRAYYLKPLRAMGGQGETRAARPKLYYALIAPDGTEVHPRLQDGTDGAWRWNKQKVEREKWRIEWKQSGKEWSPYFRIYADMSKGRPPETIFPHEEVGSNRTSRIEIKDIFREGLVFSTPKPTGLLRKLINIVADNDSLILDSFAGSGTTAHAVLELNKKDGGNRKFILVQQPFDTKENEKEQFNICEKITAERVRRVSKGYSYKTQSGKTEKVAGLGGEFAYVRVGEKLMGEYRQFGDKLPSFEEVARYIYFTETSQNFDAAKVNKTTGKIGEWKNTSYYLLYSPDRKEDRALDVAFLENLKDKNPRKVIYCEKVWVHREDLSKFGDVRPMLVPFNLK